MKMLMILILGIFPMAAWPTPKPQTFTDVPPSHFFYAEIEEVASRGIMIGSGDGLFLPDAPLPRWQAAVVIERAAFNEFNPPPFPTTLFDDVDEYDYYQWSVEDFGRRGVTNGCGTRLYCPYANTTREQVAAFIMRAKGEFNPEPPEPTDFHFLDVPQSNLFYAYIHRLKQLGITDGCAEFLYCPGDAVSRGQMARFIVRAFLSE